MHALHSKEIFAHKTIDQLLESHNLRIIKGDKVKDVNVKSEEAGELYMKIKDQLDFLKRVDDDLEGAEAYGANTEAPLPKDNEEVKINT